MNAMTEGFICPLDREDAFSQDAVAALAIMDCVRVLCALERTPNAPGAQLANGHGFASGECVTDGSMPAALHHAMQLVRQMQETGEVVMQELRRYPSGGAR